MSLQRAELLLRTRRYDDARKELHEALRQNPDDARGHLLLAQVHLQRRSTGEARHELAEALRLEPENPLAFLLLAAVEERDGHVQDATEAAKQARRLAPTWPAPVVALARIDAGRERWPSVLRRSENALALDPDDPDAAGLRALALTHLGRRDEATEAAERTLQQDPDDPQAHVVRGMTLLHRGKPRDAKQAFLEALRLDPGAANAAEGLVLSLKASSLVMRPVFAFFLWLQRMPPKLRAGLLIGAWLLANVLQQVGQRVPEVGPFVTPLVIAYLVFCGLTWVADPLMNLLLRLHPQGRHALQPAQRRAGTIFAAGLVAAVVAALLMLSPLTDANTFWLSSLAFVLAGLFGSSGVELPPSKTRWATMGAAVALAVAGSAWILSGALGLDLLAGLCVVLAVAAAFVGFLAPIARAMFR